MTNSDNGWSLQQELLHTIAQVYAWPELPPQKNHESKVLEGAAASDPCVGEYELRSDLSLTIRRVGDHLFFQVPGRPPLKLVRQRDGVYFLAYMDDTITFVRNGQGDVLALLLRQGPVETLALKRGPVG